MNTHLSAIAAVATVSACSAVASAGSLDITTDIGTATAISPFDGRVSTYGDNMVGMQVTAYFSDGLVETATWESHAVYNGTALGDGWFLHHGWDTYTEPWNLINERDAGLTRLVIDGTPGNTVFDRDFDGLPGTLETYAGSDFEVVKSSFDVDLEVTYRNAIYVPGHDIIGDAWGTLDISFLTEGGIHGYIAFNQDTDSFRGPAAVPVPSAAPLASAGLIGVAARRRR